jgi:2-iminobutanoate/2-iminopropanoate deaminase
MIGSDVNAVTATVAPEVLAGPDMPRPLGPYSPAVRAGGLIFVSSQAGIDPATGCVPPGAFANECRQAFLNVGRALRGAGADLANVVKVTVLYVDSADMQTINELFADTFPVKPPARTSAMVGLPGGRRVSIDVIATAP